MAEFFNIDDKKIEEGVEVDYYYSPGIKLVIRGMSPKIAAKHLELHAKYKNVTEDEAKQKQLDKEFDKEYKKLLADEVLVGWSGVTEDGKEVKYSKETARKFVNKYKPLFGFLSSQLGNYELFRQDKIEEKKEG